MLKKKRSGVGGENVGAEPTLRGDFVFGHRSFVLSFDRLKFLLLISPIQFDQLIQFCVEVEREGEISAIDQLPSIEIFDTDDLVATNLHDHPTAEKTRRGEIMKIDSDWMIIIIIITGRL